MVDDAQRELAEGRHLGFRQGHDCGFVVVVVVIIIGMLGMFGSRNDAVQGRVHVRQQELVFFAVVFVVAGGAALVVLTNISLLVGTARRQLIARMLAARRQVTRG